MNPLSALYLVIAFVVGFLCGVAWLRYQVKNHPEKIEKWSAEVRDAVNKARRDAADTLNNEADLIKARYEALRREMEDLINKLK